MKKERHGRIVAAARDTSHTLERRLSTLHKPVEQKLTNNKTVGLLRGSLCTRNNKKQQMMGKKKKDRCFGGMRK